MTFALAGHLPPTISDLLLDLDGSAGVRVYVNPPNVLLGSVTIPIVPAPASLPLLLVAAAAACRRSRKGRRQ